MEQITTKTNKLPLEGARGVTDMQQITILLNHQNVERLRGDGGTFNNKVSIGLTGKRITDLTKGWVDRVKRSGTRMPLDKYNELIEQRNQKWSKKDRKQYGSNTTQTELF